MNFWRKEFPRRKISLCERLYGRQSGQVEWVIGLFMVLFLGIVLCTQLQLRSYHATSLYLEDALAASNLASAVIDLEEYGISHVIQIDSAVAAYERYCDAIMGNLQLDENWEADNKQLISGRVQVENYTIYNVYENVVEVYSVDSDGEVTSWQGLLGAVKAPNNLEIEATSVYSEISFPVEGMLGVSTRAHKGKLVDIVAEAEVMAVE